MAEKVLKYCKNKWLRVFSYLVIFVLVFSVCGIIGYAQCVGGIDEEGQSCDEGGGGAGAAGPAAVVFAVTSEERLVIVSP